MKSKIQFKLAAYSDAAGKYNPQAYNNGNEDCFYVDDNLSDNQSNHFVPDQIINLSDCGMLMAVADGMGGMNAGEVASAIAIKTVEDFFAPGKVAPSMAADKKQRQQYLETLIVEADKRIKDDEIANPEHSNMGSTIILAWMVGTEITISWCGDSRAYRFNPKTGIEPLSEDHSYVQDLVRKGILTYRDTFGHPQGNIVTRSLGDPSGPARPETRHFNVFQDDIILLCSDGLSGVIYDKADKYESGQPVSLYNLQDIIANNTESMTYCRQALFDAAQKSDWYDNVTAILCQITGSPNIMPQKDESKTATPKINMADSENNLQNAVTQSVFVIPKKKIRYAFAVLLAFIIGGGVVWYWLSGRNGEQIMPTDEPEGIMEQPSDSNPALQKTDSDSIIVEEIDEEKIGNEEKPRGENRIGKSGKPNTIANQNATAAKTHDEPAENKPDTTISEQKSNTPGLTLIEGSHEAGITPSDSTSSNNSLK